MEGSPKLSGLYYPDRFGLILLTGLEEIMGRNGLNAILNLANLSQFIDNPPPDSMDRNFDFAYISALNQALEDMYGPRGGRDKVCIMRAELRNGEELVVSDKNALVSQSISRCTRRMRASIARETKRRLTRDRRKIRLLADTGGITV